MRILGVVLSPLRSAETYLRWVYLVLGGALFVPFLMAALVGVALAISRDADATVVADALPGLVAGALAAVLGGATATIRGVRKHQVQLAHALLRGPLAHQPESPGLGTGSVLRACTWLALHLVLGFVVCLVTMVALTESALLALASITNLSGGTVLVGLQQLPRWLAAPAGAAVLLGLIYGMAAVGAGTAQVASLLLGPSAADRLAAAQARADDLTERNRLAAELHDSIGHVLSVVAIQAGAAQRVMEQDPAFTGTALTSIAEQARGASAELDHVLGLLRDQSGTAAPQRPLDQLPQLVAAVRAGGTEVNWNCSGPLEALPGVLSRELYRIGQEALTNALRYGGAAPAITLEVHIEAEQVRLVATNPVPARRGRFRRSRSGGGSGVASMRERLSLLGGDLQVGEQQGQWRLSVTVPWRWTR